MDQILEHYSLKSDAPIGIEFLDTTQIPLEFLEPTFENFYNYFQADDILNGPPESYFSVVVQHVLDSTNEKNVDLSIKMESLTSDQRYRLKNRDLINERKRTSHAENREEINAKGRGRYVGNTAAKVACPKCGKQFSKSYLDTHLQYCGSDATPPKVEKVARPICDKMVCKTYLTKHILRKHPQ